MNDDNDEALIGRAIGTEFDWREYETEFGGTPVWPLVMQLYYLTNTVKKWRQKQEESDKRQREMSCSIHFVRDAETTRSPAFPR